MRLATKGRALGRRSFMTADMNAPVRACSNVLRAGVSWALYRWEMITLGIHFSVKLQEKEFHVLFNANIKITTQRFST